jgi:hypothetical protein
MWGGDSTSHDSKTQSFNETVSEMIDVTDHVLKGLSGLKIFATIGNHDAYP